MTRMLLSPSAIPRFLTSDGRSREAGMPLSASGAGVCLTSPISRYLRSDYLTFYGVGISEMIRRGNYHFGPAPTKGEGMPLNEMMGPQEASTDALQSPNASYIQGLRRQSDQLKEKARKIDDLLGLLEDNPDTKKILELMNGLGSMYG